MTSTTQIAIVGAGYAGLGVAYALRDRAVTVAIFEKSRGVGGRAATRRKNGAVYDHGANYIKGSDTAIDALVQETFASEALVTITEPVWTFDRDGHIQPGDTQDRAKWSYTDGITHLAKQVLNASNATLHSTVRINALKHTSGGWWLGDDTGQWYGAFEVLVLTPPAPQTLTLIESAEWDSPLKIAIAKTLHTVTYRSIFSFALHYPFALSTLPFYAIVNTDRAHPIGWLSREECKQGHIPEGESLLIVQMSPEWTLHQYDNDPIANIKAASQLAADLLDDPRLATPDWSDHQRWRYALPDNAADSASMQEAETEGLYGAGDWRVGQGRVHEALRNGIKIAARIIERQHIEKAGRGK